MQGDHNTPMDDSIKWFMSAVVNRDKDMDSEIEEVMLRGGMMIHRDMEVAINGTSLGLLSMNAGIGVVTIQHIISLINGLDRVIHPGNTLLEVDRGPRNE